MTMHPYRRVDELPADLPLFPLSGALLFPRWQLPLNIFEPRYLNMLDDAMAGTRMIGMVQPSGGPRDRPALANVGCAGRVTSFSETDDGRYLITLTGVARFELVTELDSATPYRMGEIVFDTFANDLTAPELSGLPDRRRLVTALKSYAAQKEIQTDWEAVNDAPIESLVHALCAGCPFTPMEKQALLEAPDLKARCETLIALFEIDSRDDDRGSLQ